MIIGHIGLIGPIEIITKKNPAAAQPGFSLIANRFYYEHSALDDDLHARCFMFPHFPPGRRRRPLWAGGHIPNSDFRFHLPPPPSEFHFPIPKPQPAFVSFTAHTLYSGMPEMGSSAALVRRLAAANGIVKGYKYRP